MVNVKAYKRNIKTRKYEEHILQDIDREIRSYKVTYRGMGIGKMAEDFYKFSKQTGYRIKYKGSEYIVTDTTFKKLKTIGSIDFKAPYRNERYM